LDIQFELSTLQIVLGFHIQRTEENMKRLLVLLLLLSVVSQLPAQDSKPVYHLFNPVPRAELREFALDRPDVTESPQTVDAGHFQFEGDVVKWQKPDKDSDGTVLLWNGLYKMGLAKNWDVHVGYELYNITPNYEGANSPDGHGALTFRVKRNFWGNEGDTKTALGTIPYVSFTSGNPFDSNEEIQYGVGFPFSCSINDKLGWGGQPQVDFIPDGEGGHEFSFFQTVVLGGSLIGKFDFYVEVVGVFNSIDNQYLANGGVIYNVSPNVKVDIATNIGLTNVSPTRIYLGFSCRI
jgi:hypothetical protein